MIVPQAHGLLPCVLPDTQSISLEWRSAASQFTVLHSPDHIFNVLPAQGKQGTGAPGGGPGAGGGSASDESEVGSVALVPPAPPVHCDLDSVRGAP